MRELTSVYLAEVYDAVAYLPGGTKARKLLVENSIKYLAGLEREAHDSPQLQRDLAVAYDRLGDVQGDYIGANLGDTQGALESYRRALRLRRALVEHDPTLRGAPRAAAQLREAERAADGPEHRTRSADVSRAKARNWRTVCCRTRAPLHAIDVTPRRRT